MNGKSTLLTDAWKSYVLCSAMFCPPECRSVVLLLLQPGSEVQAFRTYIHFKQMLTTASPVNTQLIKTCAATDHISCH